MNWDWSCPRNDPERCKQIFNKYKFDSVMILGDRIERLPIVAAALAYRKFIFHIHGVRLLLVLE